MDSDVEAAKIDSCGFNSGMLEEGDRIFAGSQVFSDFCMVRAPLRFLLFLILSTILTINAYGQKQDRIWYFGNHAGLDFNSTTPTPLSNSVMNAVEGCTAASDTTGNLLFYTDGKTVWNKNHTVMPNGTGLFGDGRASQTGVVVPAPNNLDKYFLFTVDTNAGINGMSYSEIDMTLNGGLGDISIKNVPLTTPVTEKVAAVRHSNFRDAWVLVHGWSNANYMAYLVSPTGVAASPVLSMTGNVTGTTYTQAHGYLKASPDMKKLAAAIRGQHIVEVSDFNPATGIVSNSIQLNFTREVYGVEFSPNSRYLYVATFSNPSDIFQFDLLAGTAAQISASQVNLGTYSGHLMGALQRGPDGRIYMSPYAATTLPTIDAPDLAGSFCAYNPAGQALAAGTSCNYGLPNFLQSIFISADFTYTDTCSGAPTNFQTVFAGPDSVKWDFDDLSSGSFNTSTTVNPAHQFSSAGNYNVMLIVYQGALSDTVYKTVHIIQTPAPYLGNTIQLCTGNTTSISTTYPANSTMTWQDGSHVTQFLVDTPGIYWVEVDLYGCKGRDSVTASFTAPPTVNLGGTHTICSDSVFYLDATTANATYLWQDGSIAATYHVTTSSVYSVTVTVNGCTGTDHSLVDVTQTPQFSLGTDTTICRTFALYLNATNVDPNAVYLWEDGTTNPSKIVEDPGKYWVTVDLNGCIGRDTITIDQQDKPIVFLGDDTLICIGQPLELNAYNYGATYLWQDGSNDSIFTPRVTGKYYVEVENLCGIAADTIYVTANDCYCDVFVPNAFSPNNDGKNDVFQYRATCENFTAELTIYNRIGQLVFKSTDPEAIWDGNYEGKKATEGIYVYVLKYRGYNNGRLAREEKRGTIALIR